MGLAGVTDARHRGRNRVLAVLCVTEIVSWGILYYAFPVLTPSITDQTGWSTTAVTAAFSASQVVAALSGVVVGRILDRSGPRWIMTAGSVLAVPSLLLVATAQNLAVFTVGWMLAGVAMGAVLYPPAFAALTRWWGTERTRALLILTLAAGLASTVFAPVTALLDTHGDWRSTYLILVVVLAVITVPAHALGLRGQWPALSDAELSTSHSGLGVVRSGAFVALTAALSVASFVAFAGIFNLVPLLVEHGQTTSVAALTLGLGGAGQVVGRIGYLPLQRLSVRARMAAVVVAIAVTTAILGVVTSTAAVVGVAVGAGVARGLLTLVQASAIADRWGSAHYGRLNGVMSAPIVVAMALAPFAGAVLASVAGSYSNAYLILGGLAMVAAGLGLASVPAVGFAARGLGLR